MAKRQRGQRYLDEATMQALVRFGPELRGLQTLMRQAEQTYAGRLATAREQATAVRREAARQVPVIGEIFDDAESRFANARSVVDQNLAQLGPVGANTAISQALELERLGGAQDLARGRADALTELQTVRRQARLGWNQLERQAQNEYVDAVQQILGQAQGIAREQGAFTAATAGDLREAARQRAQELRIARENNQRALDIAELEALTDLEIARGDRRARRREARRERRHDREMALLEASLDGGGSGKGRGWLSQTQHNALKSDVENALRAARRYKQSGMSRQAAATLLLDGYQGDKGKGRPPIKPAANDQFVASLALDLAYNKQNQISTNNARELRRRGYKLDVLGWPRTPPRSQGRRGSGSVAATAGAALAGLLDFLGA